jgi:hypothetical protein
MTSPGQAKPRSPIERQLNIGLMVVQVVAALIVAYAVAFVAFAWDGDGERSRAESLQIGLVFLALPGVVVFLTAQSARRRLADQAASTRLFGMLTGSFAVLAGLPLLSSVFGMVSIVAGLFTLTAAFLLKKDQVR